MLRGLSLIAGLAGAVALSQFPEFSQQYLQRLGGRAEALSQVVAEFDAAAARAGLDRAQALDQISGTDFLASHQGDMRALITRADRAQADYTLLRAASPLERLALPQRFRDRETLAAAWADFRPAVPATADGAIAAAVGFVLGWGLMRLLAWPVRRRTRT